MSSSSTITKKLDFSTAVWHNRPRRDERPFKETRKSAEKRKILARTSRTRRDPQLRSWIWTKISIAWFSRETRRGQGWLIPPRNCLKDSSYCRRGGFCSRWVDHSSVEQRILVHLFDGWSLYQTGSNRTNSEPELNPVVEPSEMSRNFNELKQHWTKRVGRHLHNHRWRVLLLKELLDQGLDFSFSQLFLFWFYFVEYTTFIVYICELDVILDSLNLVKSRLLI